MRDIQLRDAKATLSAVVDSAERGEPTVITRRGKRTAVVVGFAEWERLSRVPSFGRLLMEAPIEPRDLPKRNAKPLRDAGLSRSAILLLRHRRYRQQDATLGIGAYER